MRLRTYAFVMISLAVLLEMSEARAAAQRTFVASYGSPMNTSFNCSIAKPCRAFSEAIGVTNPKGEVVVLDVLDTIVRDNGDGGLALVAQDASIVMDHVRNEHNVNVGFYIAPVVPATFARATIADSVFASNGGCGIWADTVGAAETTVVVERTVFAEMLTRDSMRPPAPVAHLPRPYWREIHFTRTVMEKSIRLA